MDGPEDARLEPRVSNLESEVLRIKEQVGISRADAQAARMLAGGLDREIADLRTLVRAQTHVLQALRDTQIEHGQSLVEQGKRLDRHERLLTELRSDMQRGFGDMHAGMAQIVALLTNRERDESG